MPGAFGRCLCVWTQIFFPDEGVVYLDVIYVIDNIFGSDSKMLFGKLFFAIINATIGICDPKPGHPR